MFTEYIAGFTIWQYCDTRTAGPKFLKRPKTKNNKGILDESHHPKESGHRIRMFLTESVTTSFGMRGRQPAR